MKKKSERKKFFLFYPADWLSDFKLNRCTLKAQGAWIRLLSFMHQGNPYGHLADNGRVMTEEDIRKKILHLSDKKEFDIVWDELVLEGVIKKDEKTGAFYSKRLVTDYEKFGDKIENGEKVIDPTFIKYAEIIIKYLNKKTNKNFEFEDRFINLIAGKLQSGVPPEHFQQVIDSKCEEWLTQEKMVMYLRPMTLFGDKFETYFREKSLFTQDEREYK
jgi:uncharacterized phage protein (TIGR02220 family)